MRIRLGSLTIDYPPAPLTDQEMREIFAARDICRKLNDLARGRPADDPRTWLSVGRRLGCRIREYEAPFSCLGEYAPTRKGTGVITYNTCTTLFMQARVLVHELAHHLLWSLGIVPWWDASVRYNSHPDEFCHRVARRVERMLVG